MALLPVLIAPDPRLKNKADPVESVNSEIRGLINNMLETLYDQGGVGLAAIQVGIKKRVIVIDLGKEQLDAGHSAPLIMVNPEFISVSSEKRKEEEGCLSVPNYYEYVARSSEVKVAYTNENNERVTIQAQGILATCIQHEIDHLNGVLFIDHLSALKKNFITRKLQKEKKYLAV